MRWVRSCKDAISHGGVYPIPPCTTSHVANPLCHQTNHLIQILALLVAGGGSGVYLVPRWVPSNPPTSPGRWVGSPPSPLCAPQWLRPVFCFGLASGGGGTWEWKPATLWPLFLLSLLLLLFLPFPSLLLSLLPSLLLSSFSGSVLARDPDTWPGVRDQVCGQG